MIIKSLILGVVQGATEFLPVSSSAHLVFTQHVLGLNWTGSQAAAFDIALHLGTALAIVCALWKDIVSICRGLFSIDSTNEFGDGKRVFLLIVVATIPAVIVALLFKSEIESLFVKPKFAGFTLIVTGFVLFLTKFVKNTHYQLNGCKLWKSFVIGCSQALAILPGISRSGSTISCGLLLGLKRETTAKFSFLMFLPAIIGATILEFPHLSSSNFTILELGVGFISSFLVGFVCVKWMIAIVSNARLWLFSPYCWVMGLIVVFLSK